MKINFLFVLMILISLVGCDRLQSNSKPDGSSTKQRAIRWEAFTTFSGKGNLHSKLFPISDRQIKVIGQYSGNPNDTFIVYLLKNGESLDKHGGFPLIMERGSGKKELFLEPKPDEYYLNVLSNNAKWNITLFEEF